MRRGIALTGVLLLSLPASAAVITFDTIAIGTRTPFSDSQAGLQVSFSSPDGGVFSVYPAFFVALSGNVLLDADSAAHVLNVTFSRPLASVSLLFALNSATDRAFSLTALSGGISGAPVGSTTATAVAPRPGAYPEGSIAFSSSTGFDAIRLTSSAQDFAIDNVNAVEIPEPGSVLLIGGGLLIACAAATRKRALQPRNSVGGRKHARNALRAADVRVRNVRSRHLRHVAIHS